VVLPGEYGNVIIGQCMTLASIRPKLAISFRLEKAITIILINGQLKTQSFLRHVIDHREEEEEKKETPIVM
jgi:hypothetical protein